MGGIVSCSRKLEAEYQWSMDSCKPGRYLIIPNLFSFKWAKSDIQRGQGYSGTPCRFHQLWRFGAGGSQHCLATTKLMVSELHHLLWRKRPFGAALQFHGLANVTEPKFRRDPLEAKLYINKEDSEWSSGAWHALNIFELVQVLTIHEACCSKESRLWKCIAGCFPSVGSRYDTEDGHLHFAWSLVTVWSCRQLQLMCSRPT